MAETGAQAVAKKRLTDDAGLGVTGTGTTVDATDKTVGEKAANADGAENAKYVSSIGATTADITALSQALARQYDNAQYSVRTAEERQAQAQLENDTYYSQMRRAAQQQQEQNDLRLQQQRNALQSAYDRNRAQAAQQYAQAYSQADRALLARGMGRSSYGMQTLSNVAMQGAQAQGEIWRQQAEKEQEIEDQRTQLSQQLQQTLAGYEAEQAKDTLKRVQEMEETDYDRNVKAAERQTNIAQQLYTNLYQQQRDTVADAQWLREQNEAIRQWNLQHGRDPSAGAIYGTGTNTSADTYYGVGEDKFFNGGGGGGSSDSGWKRPNSSQVKELDGSGLKKAIDDLGKKSSSTKSGSASNQGSKRPIGGYSPE
jgi:hypothetical protein